MTGAGRVEFQKINLETVQGHGFNFSIGGEKLGFVYIGSEKYSLVWTGRTDSDRLFAHLEESALAALSFSRGKDAPIRISDSRLRIILQPGYEGIAINPSQPEDYRSYAARLADPSGITFVRYHLVNPISENDIEAAFTANNSKLAGEEEVAVQLPRSVIPSREPIDWMLKNCLNPDLASEVDQATFVSKLVEIIENPLWKYDIVDL